MFPTLKERMSSFSACNNSMSGEELEDWAVRDGFSDFQAADRWFSRTYNSDFWLKPEFDEIQFVPVWL